MKQQLLQSGRNFSNKNDRDGGDWIKKYEEAIKAFE
jgi:hypothetical protein